MLTVKTALEANLPNPPADAVWWLARHAATGSSVAVFTRTWFDARHRVAVLLGACPMDLECEVAP